MRIVTCGFKEVRAVGFTPDGRTLIAFGDRPIPGHCEWHDLTGNRPPRVQPLRLISWNGFAISPHDGTAFVGAATCWLEYTPDGVERHTQRFPEGRLWQLAVSPHAEFAVCSQEGLLYGRDRRPIRLIGYTRKGTGWKRAWRHDGVGTRFGPPVFLPDGQRLAVIELRGGKVKGQFVPESALVILSTKGKVLGDRSFRDAICLAVCGEFLTLGDNHRFRVFPLADFTAEPTVVSLGPKHLYELCGDPLGRFLLAACGKEVLVFDPVSWKRTHTFDWQIGTVNCLAVSPDGTVAAAGGDKGKVAVWDVE